MSRRTWIVAAALAATLGLTQVAQPSMASEATTITTLPMVLGPWTGSVAPPLPDDVREVLAADEYVHRFYDGPGGMLEMDIAYYGRPRIGATMHSPLNCLPGNGWEISNVSEQSIAGAGSTWPVRQLTVNRADQSFTLLYWFQSRNRISSNEVSSRMYMLADTLRRRSTENSLVRVFVPSDLIRNDPSLLTRFAARLIPEIATRLN